MDRQTYWTILLQEARARRWEQGLDQPASDWSLLNIVSARSTLPHSDPGFDADWTRVMTEVHDAITRPSGAIGGSTDLIADAPVQRERLEHLDGCLREFGAIDAKTGSQKMHAFVLRYFDRLDWPKIADISRLPVDEVREQVQLCLEWVGMKARAR